MSRYFIEVSYNGTKYSGFQVQENAVTIQSEVENALRTCFRKPFDLTGASRTDAGVHALQNYFHFDSDDDVFYSTGNLNNQKSLQQALYSLNSILPGDIAIKRLFKVADKTHCRFDALSRQYKYYIYQKKSPFLKDTAYFYPYKLDFEKLQEAAAIILRTENFAAFSKRNTQVNNFTCSVYKSEWHKKNNLTFYEVIANRFLRGMVRGLVGTMLKVGTAKISLNEFTEIIESKNCTNADFSVAACGLYLTKVNYHKL